MRKRKKLVIGGIVVVALGAVVAGSLARGRGDKGTPVTLAHVKVGTVVGKVSGPGVVNPEAIVDISAHLPGEITRLGPVAVRSFKSRRSSSVSTIDM